LSSETDEQPGVQPLDIFAQQDNARVCRHGLTQGIVDGIRKVDPSHHALP
jgi:hypothetical protein